MNKSLCLLITVTLLTLSACSNQQIYEANQANQRQECGKLPPPQYRECMEQTDRSYDEYEQQRKEVYRK